MAGADYNRAVERNENRLAMLNDADDSMALAALRAEDRDQIENIEEARGCLDKLRASLIYERQHELAHRRQERHTHAT